MKMYYTKIKYIGLGRNGSWFFGGHAVTTLSDKSKGGRKMEIRQFGKNELDAKKKLISALNADPNIELIEVC